MAKSGRLELGDNIYGHYRSIFNQYDVFGQQSNRIPQKKRKIRAITWFKIIQGHRGRYQSKACMRVPITVCTVVQKCCKVDSPCGWNTWFRPSGIENPSTDLHQIWQGDYVGTPHANFGISIPKVRGCTYAWNCHHPCLFFTPLLLFDFLCTCWGRTVWPIFVFYGSKDVFPRQLHHFGVPTKNSNNFPYFCKKRNIPYSRNVKL